MGKREREIMRELTRAAVTGNRRERPRASERRIGRE